VELRNRWVHFQICDVYYPDPAKVLTDLHGHDVFQGRVVDLTDGGDNGSYAVVEVDGLSQPIVIAVRNLLGVL
jgi:hypothetical protein